MWHNFKTTKAEKTAIERAFYEVQAQCRWADCEAKALLKTFRKDFGPGMSKTAAQGLIVKTFQAGMDRRDEPLARFVVYNNVEIMAQGAAYGADNDGTIAAGVKAYSNAFQRSITLDALR